MTPQVAFQLVNTSILLPWLLLLAAPRWSLTQLLVRSGAWSGGLAVAYLLLLVWRLPHWPSDASFSTLKGVAALFVDPWGLLTGWVHYLCFDLWVGAWVVNDADRRGLLRGWPRWVTVPALVLTFLFGPVGFLLWLGLRRVLPAAPAAA